MFSERAFSALAQSRALGLSACSSQMNGSAASVEGLGMGEGVWAEAIEAARALIVRVRRRVRMGVFSRASGLPHHKGPGRRDKLAWLEVAKAQLIISAPGLET